MPRGNDFHSLTTGNKCRTTGKRKYARLTIRRFRIPFEDCSPHSDRWRLPANQIWGRHQTGQTSNALAQKVNSGEQRTNFLTSLCSSIAAGSWWGVENLGMRLRAQVTCRGALTGTFHLNLPL